MARYLTEKGEPPDRPLVAVCPISTRSKGATDLEGNQLSIMRTSLWTDIEDPVERLAAISKSTSTTKAAQKGVAAEVLLEMSEALPGHADRSRHPRGGPAATHADGGEHDGHERPWTTIALLLQRRTGADRHGNGTRDGRARSDARRDDVRGPVRVPSDVVSQDAAGHRVLHGMPHGSLEELKKAAGGRTVRPTKRQRSRPAPPAARRVSRRDPT